MKSLKIKEKTEYEEFFSDPLWYQELPREIEHYLLNERPEEAVEKKVFTEQRLKLTKIIAEIFQEHKISLAKEGLNFDEDRKQIDTIVIHHSAEPSEMSWEEINVMHMIRLYLPEFLNRKREYSGKPLWSNHFIESYMIFCGYHFLIWPNGSTKRMLNDDEIGWHAGNWDVNCRSIGICFMGDLSNTYPTDDAISACRDIISDYVEVKIFGHNEIYDDTICPGDKFLEGWKENLLVR